MGFLRNIKPKKIQVFISWDVHSRYLVTPWKELPLFIYRLVVNLEVSEIYKGTSKLFLMSGCTFFFKISLCSSVQCYFLSLRLAWTSDAAFLCFFFFFFKKVPSVFDFVGLFLSCLMDNWFVLFIWQGFFILFQVISTLADHITACAWIWPLLGFTLNQILIINAVINRDALEAVYRLFI